MDILITGHKGFIGSYLYKNLAKNNRVYGIDLIDGENILHCDLPYTVDVVIHLAGKSGVRESITDPASYWMNNVEASRRLFERYKNTRILYASSSSAYEPDLNPYAASKFIVEELAARHTNNLGMRFHTVYSDTPRQGMFLDKLLNGSLEYITNHYRDFIHIKDLYSAICLLLEKDYLSGVIDIGTGCPTKISTLAPDLPIRLNTPGERQFTCANIEKLKNLGWKPKYSIEKFLTNKHLDNNIILMNGDSI